MLTTRTSDVNALMWPHDPNSDPSYEPDPVSNVVEHDDRENLRRKSEPPGQAHDRFQLVVLCIEVRRLVVGFKRRHREREILCDRN